MRYKLLGRSGLRVSELALGTMTFGEEWGWGASKEESKKIFDAYAEAGGNFVDTANRYTEGTSEKFVGDFIAADREHFVVATKYTLFMRRDDPNFSGNHRKNMVQALEASLKRLKTDYVDLYWVHAWDYTTPVEEVMRGLDDLVRSGKVLYIGISDTPAWIVSQANTMADLRGWSRFVGLQLRYSLIDRTVERELLPMARALDLGVTPWSVLGSGVLTGKYNQGDTTGRA
nr:aldo/keto reductase [Anaerolineae bacterium]